MPWLGRVAKIAERKNFHQLFLAPCRGHDTRVDLDSDLSSDLGLGMFNWDEFRLGEMFSPTHQVAPDILMEVWTVYFSAAHIFSRKGLKGMKPSSSAGSHSSFIRFLASSLESLQALYMGKTSGLDRNFSPLATPPPISLMVFRVGFRLQARTRSPT